jgi:hypothetical protein
VRLIKLRAQLRDGPAQEFELGALFIAQFDAPIPSLIGLSHRPVFAVRRHPPARRAPACSHSDRGRVRRGAREMVPTCRICSGSRRTGFLEALTPSSPSATSMASRLVNAASATVGKEPIGPPCPRNYGLMLTRSGHERPPRIARHRRPEVSTLALSWGSSTLGGAGSVMPRVSEPRESTSDHPGSSSEGRAPPAARRPSRFARRFPCSPLGAPACVQGPPALLGNATAGG